jgi:two-component system, sensor histidine kinase PdtaS
MVWNMRARMVVLFLLFAVGFAGPSCAQRNSDSLRTAALEKKAEESLVRSDFNNVWKYLDEAAAICRLKGNKEAEAQMWRESADNWEVTGKLVRDAKIDAYGRARKAYLEAHDTEDAALMLKNNADLHLNGNQLSLAKQELLQVLGEYKTIHYSPLYYTYDLLHVVCRAGGDIVGEVFYAVKMIETADTAEISFSDATYFNLRMAEAYRDAGMNERSLFFTRKAFELGHSLPNDEFPLYLGCAYAFDLIRNDSPAKAVAIVLPFLKGLTAQDHQARARLENVLCLAYASMKKLDLSEQTGLRCVAEADSLYDHRPRELDYHMPLQYYVCLVQTYILRREFRKAQLFMNRIHSDTAGLYTLVDLRSLALARARIDSGLGLVDSAMFNFQHYMLYNDSLYGIDKTIRINEIYAKYEVERKDKDLLLLQKDNRLQQAQAQRSRLVRNMMIIAIVLLVIFSILVYNRYRTKQIFASELQLQKEQIAGRNIALEKLLRENEWLLREVHHRVKNNLQLVMSLLNTQSAHTDNEQAFATILESRQRMFAMSLIHQKLYQTANMTVVNMETYVPELVSFLKESYTGGGRIRFDLQVTAIELDVAQAVPIGLILNEAITNAMKYAFVDGQSGNIRISMALASNGLCTLIVKDNGKGLSPGFDLHKKGSMGVSLMEALTEQLSGKIDFIEDGGLTVNLTFMQRLIEAVGIECT